MSEPTVPAPTESEGWPPRVPENTNPTSSYPSIAPPPMQHPFPEPSYQHPYYENDPSLLAGEKLAKTSTIFGIISIFFAGVILGPLAIIRGSRAEKLGVDSTIGKTTGWIGTILAAISLVFLVLYIFVLGAIFSGIDQNPSDIKTGGFTNSQEIRPHAKSDSVGGTGGDAYDKLAPAEKAEVNRYLEEIVGNR